MINRYDVNLIIFDTDGTIIPSLGLVYESIKRAFAKLGWKVNFGPEDINQFFGLPSSSDSGGGLYQYIKPPESELTWSELRDKVREEYRSVFTESAQTFPGVRETLETLRTRGYRLALYSNASTQYFDIVTSSFNIQDYFDYAECVRENDLTKPELVSKIKDRFDSSTAAVVGDRVHDIEAARETDSLSIGVLFGYGGEEPERADITINSFGELLTIFDRRLPVFENILGEVNKRKIADRPFVIAVSGIDCSGKTMFTNALNEYFISRNLETQIINLDDFHNPRGIRYAGDNQADNYYNRSFNLKEIIKELLAPLRENREYSTTLKLLDVDTDKYEPEKTYSFTPETIVLFEGVFLFRKELAPYIDYRIFLDISFEESKQRAKTRDPEAIIRKYDEKYLAAQGKYLREYPPQDAADMIIDNTNWEYPVTRKVR
jgi:HAD superfamily hydrolase (TIGR01549 family)